MKSFADVLNNTSKPNNSNNNLNNNWIVLRCPERTVVKKETPPSNAEILNDEWNMAFELDRVLYDIYLRRENESRRHFMLTGEYDTFALEKIKYNELKKNYPYLFNDDEDDYIYYDESDI